MSFIRLFSRILIASCLLAPFPLSVLAQSSPPTVNPANDTGVNPYETYEGNRENINLSSGNVNITIPLLTFPGRNGLDYPLALHYDSKSVWQLRDFVDPNTGIVTYNWLLSSGWSNSIASIIPSLFSVSSTVNCNGYLLQMPDGSNHAFPGVRAQCVFSSTGQPATSYNEPIGDSSDGLSTSIDATTYTNLIVYLANGTKFYFNGTSLTKIEDRNGNIISFTYPSSGTTVISDTLGRKVTITSVSSTSSTITYLDSAGVSRTISLTYVSVKPTQPPTNPSGGYGPTSVLALSSVTLPSGLQFHFQYNNSAELGRAPK